MIDASRQFVVIQIPAAKLNLANDILIEFPHPIRTLVLPPSHRLEDSTLIVSQLTVTDYSVGVRLNSPKAPILEFGLNATYISRVDAPIERIYVRTLNGPPTDVYLLGLIDVDFKYSGQLFAGNG